MRRAILLTVLSFTLGCSDDSSPPPPQLESGPPLAEAGGPGAPTGDPCKSSPDCEGRVCLTTVVYMGQPTLFPDGYCTRKCPGGIECIAGESCVIFRDAAATPVGSYCIKTCTAPTCRTGYICTSAVLCLPR